MTTQPLSVRDEIRAFRFAPDQWLWCLHCGRFFQGRDARADGLGGVQACAFAGCDGAGYGVDLFDWNEWPRGAPAVAARWPRREALEHGLVAEAWRDGDDDGLDAFADDDGDGGDDARAPDPDDDDAFEPDYAAVFARPAPDRRIRDALLGVSSDDVMPGEATYFRGLDAERLERLVAAGYAQREAATRRGPPIAEFLAFLQRWPDVRAHGHVVHLGQPAGDALVLDGVECDLRRLPRARRDAIRSEFLDRFAHADEYIDEPDWLFAWFE